MCVDIHVQAAGSQICLQNICGQQRNSPMADPIFGSKYGPQNRVQNWITFSFLLLGLCLGPFLGSRFGPKSGASHRKILLLSADVLQADLRRTSMSVSVNTCFFSLCVPICFLYSMALDGKKSMGFPVIQFLKPSQVWNVIYADHRSKFIHSNKHALTLVALITLQVYFSPL